MASVQSFEARRDRGRLGLLLGALLLVSLLALFLPIPTDGLRLMEQLIFALRVAGGLGLVVLIFKIPALLKPRIEAKISADGLVYIPFSDQMIGWDQISAIKVRTLSVQKVLSVYLVDPTAFKVKRAAQLQSRLNKSAGDFGDFTIQVALTDRSLQDFKLAFEPFKPVTD